jgi:phage shock protein A
MAVGALILSISATAFGGSANAAPSADDTKSCSTLAHERNDAVHTLHAALNDFRDQLKDLARDARELQRDARHSKPAIELTGDARKEVADARAQLMEIWTSAHEEIQSRVELGQACKDADTEDEDDTSSSTTTTTTTNTTTTTSGTDVSTEDLVAKYKEVVDQAIKDMQAVLDDVTAAVAKLTTAAQSTDDSLAAKVKAERAKEKDARNTEHGKPDRTGGRGNGKGPRG